MPYAYTEQGVAMLSGVLRSRVAIRVSVQMNQAATSIPKRLLESIYLRKPKVRLTV
ncbi:MAG: hypothetical protein ACI361_09725 [Atopobiaceae bacterium]